MQEQGFTNYSYECWHFDYGNQMYAMMLKFLVSRRPGTVTFRHPRP